MTIEVVNYWLWVIVIALYAPMLPTIALLLWLEMRHPTLYAKLPRWLH